MFKFQTQFLDKVWTALIVFWSMPYRMDFNSSFPFFFLFGFFGGVLFVCLFACFNFCISFFNLCSKYLSLLVSLNLSPTPKSFHMTRDSNINRFKNPRLHSCTGYNKITAAQNISKVFHEASWYNTAFCVREWRTLLLSRTAVLGAGVKLPCHVPSSQQRQSSLSASVPACLQEGFSTASLAQSWL